MKRRDFVSVIFCSVILARPTCARSANPKAARIALLQPGEVTLSRQRYYQAFRDAMRALGWIEGHNLILDYRSAEGRWDRAPELVAALVQTRPDVIVALGGAAVARIFRQATAKIPIVVVAMGGDPVADGLIKSFSRPGGNITGSSAMLLQLNSKRVELLVDAFPRIHRIAFIWNTAITPSWDPEKELSKAARSLDRELVLIGIRRPEDLSELLPRIKQAQPDALAIAADPVILESNIESTLALLSESRLPAIFPWRSYVEAGGLLSYGPSLADLYARAASTVDHILKGASPADLPFEQPVVFELIINLKTGKASGIQFPQSILARADEVIE